MSSTRREALGLGLTTGALLAMVSTSSGPESALLAPTRSTEFAVNVADHGADPTGAQDSTAQLQEAIALAAVNGQRVIARGTFKISDTLEFKGNADFSDAVLSYAGSGLAVQVGSSDGTLQRCRILLPAVIAAWKTRAGWREVVGSVGVRVLNAYACEIDIPLIRNFETGLHITGSNHNGTSYCQLRMGHLDNNKINHHLSAGATGWSNQNTFTGGRWSHYSDEGRNVGGTRHILMGNSSSTSAPNGNLWLNPSLESPGVVDFTLDILRGSYNMWMNPRFEFSGGSSEVRWGAGAVRNWIMGGVGVDAIVETWLPGSTQNSILGTAFNRMMTAGPKGLVLENTAGNGSPVFTVLRAGGTALRDDPNSAYTSRLEAGAFKGKRHDDAANRVELDLANGRLRLGTGTVAPLANWVGAGTNMLLGSTTRTLGFEIDNTQDIGSPSANRPRFVRAATAVTTGSFVTGDRPAASTAGEGASIWDKTLGKPIWSNGAVWVEATGKQV